MRKTTSVALLSLCLVFINTSTTNAISPTIINQPTEDAVEVLEFFYDDIAVLDVALEAEELTGEEPAEEAPAASEAPEEAEEAEEPVVHTVKANESLSKISKEYDVDWQRIYAKNTELQNPDILEIGQELTIPEEDEELELREIPVAAPAPAPAAASSAPAATSQPAPAATITRPATTAGNTYYAGYCTWYAKNRRPDLPNNLGNANTWLSRAAAQGYATGSTPRVGAVAYALTGYMHVAYVEAVHGDGTITVSEMNYAGFNQVTTRTAPASQFSYIY